MKKIFLALLTLSISCFVNSAYAYCVQNRTQGQETIRHGQPHDTTIYWTQPHKYFVAQGGSQCDKKVSQKMNAQSSIEIRVAKRFEDKNESNKHIAESDAICQVNVYNKGGYVIVRGSAGNYNCDVYRD